MRVLFWNYNEIKISTLTKVSFLLIGSIFLTPFTAIALTKTKIPKKQVTQVQLGEIVLTTTNNNCFILKTRKITLTGSCTDNLKVYLGTGEETFTSSLQAGMIVYAFGIINSASSTITVEKVIIKNKSRLARKNQKEVETGFIAALFKNKENQDKKVSQEQESSPSLELVTREFSY